MNKQRLSFAAAAAAGLMAFATPTVSQEAKIIQAGIVEDVGAQEHIDLAGKLRMLSQRIPSAACHLAEGVDTDGATKMLAGATAEFDKILNALENGDPELGIPYAETRRKTLIRIFSLREAWEPFKAAANAMASGYDSEANLEYLIANNLDVLERAKLLVSEEVAEYSNPAEMVQADAIVIDIAGRQRMLLQKIAKESCLIASHHETPETAAQLAGTIELFNTSLQALQNGMPAAGIKAPPTTQISAGLGTVSKDWRELRPLLDDILAGKEVGLEAEIHKFRVLNTTMADMNAVVGLYAAYAKKDI